MKKYAYLVIFTDTRNDTNSLRIVSEKRPTVSSAVRTTVLASAEGEDFSEAYAKLLDNVGNNLAALADNENLAAALAGDELNKFILERAKKDPGFLTLLAKAENDKNPAWDTFKKEVEDQLKNDRHFFSVLASALENYRAVMHYVTKTHEMPGCRDPIIAELLHNEAMRRLQIVNPEFFKKEENES